jgi:hypothetical protein
MKNIIERIGPIFGAIFTVLAILSVNSVFIKNTVDATKIVHIKKTDEDTKIVHIANADEVSATMYDEAENSYTRINELKKIYKSPGLLFPDLADTDTAPVILSPRLPVRPIVPETVPVSIKPFHVVMFVDRIETTTVSAKSVGLPSVFGNLSLGADVLARISEGATLAKYLNGDQLDSTGLKNDGFFLVNRNNTTFIITAKEFDAWYDAWTEARKWSMTNSYVITNDGVVTGHGTITASEGSIVFASGNDSSVNIIDSSVVITSSEGSAFSGNITPVQDYYFCIIAGTDLTESQIADSTKIKTPEEVYYYCSSIMVDHFDVPSARSGTWEEMKIFAKENMVPGSVMDDVAEKLDGNVSAWAYYHNEEYDGSFVFYIVKAPVL